MKRLSVFLLALAMVITSIGSGFVSREVKAASTWRSALYPENWTPGYSINNGSQYIQDFSYAGYKKGEEALPTSMSGTYVDVTQSPYNADSTGANDATDAIQNAINAVQNAGGGTVYLPAGTYKVKPKSAESAALKITGSNVLFKGAGVGKTYIRCFAENMRYSQVIWVTSSSGSWDTVSGANQKLTKDITKPTTSIPVSDVSGFKAGDWVVVRSDRTQGFIDEHQMNGFWSASQSPSTMGPTFYRQVVSVNSSAKTVEIDIPTRYALKTRDNARIYKVNAPNQRNTGLMDFSIGNKMNPRTNGWGEEDYKTSGTGAYETNNAFLIKFSNNVNCFAKNIASYQAGNSSLVHMSSNGLDIGKTRNLTVENCDFSHPQYEGGGGNGYGMNVCGQETLIKDCSSTSARHSFAFKYSYANGNVVYHYKSTDPKYGSDFHMYLSMSNLIDNEELNGDFVETHVRPYGGTDGNRHGVTSSQTVFWNTKGNRYKSGSNYIIDSRQHGYGYIIGTQGSATNVKTTPTSESSQYGNPNTAPEDYKEGIGDGATLSPQSLYYDQLSRRLNGAPQQEATTEAPTDKPKTYNPVQVPETSGNTSGLMSVGYLPNWSASGFYQKINWSALTHICLAFCNPNTSGELSYASDSLTKNIVNLAHQNGVKVMASLGGADYGDNYTALVTSSRMDSFNDQIISFAQKYNLDGIDIDIEGDSHTSQSVWNNYEEWIRTLGIKCHNNNLLFTTAIGQWYASNVTNKTLTYFDYVQLMEYDCSASTYPSRINYFMNTKGVPAKKIVLGVPFYADGPYTAYSEIVNQDRGKNLKSRVEGIMPLVQNYAGVMNWELTQDTTDSTSLLKVIKDNVYGGQTAPRGNAATKVTSIPGTVKVTDYYGKTDGVTLHTATSGMSYAGDFHDGNYINFYVNASAPGTYKINIPVGAGNPQYNASGLKVKINDDELATLKVKESSDWETFINHEASFVANTAGSYKIAFVTVGGAANIGDFTVSKVGETPTTTKDPDDPGDIITHPWGEDLTDVNQTTEQKTNQTTTTQVETTKASGNIDNDLQAPFGLGYAGYEELPFYFAWGALNGMDGFNVFVDGNYVSTETGFAANLDPDLFAEGDEHTVAIQSVKGDKVSNFTAITYNKITGEVKEAAVIIDTTTAQETTEESTTANVTTTANITTTQQQTTASATTTHQQTTTQAQTTTANVTTTQQATTKEVTTANVTTQQATTANSTTTQQVTTQQQTTASATTTHQQTTYKNYSEIENEILKAKKDKDPEGSTFGKLTARVKKSAKKANKVVWKAVDGAKKYIVFGGRCGKAIKKLKTVTKKSFTHKKLKKGKYYKYLVVAVDADGKVLAISKMIHSATKGGKVGNAKKIKVNKANVTLSVGGTFNFKAKQIKTSKKIKIKNHRKLSYESTNDKVVSVSKKGVITGLGKGTCSIFVYAQNGVFKEVEVTVN